MLLSSWFKRNLVYSFAQSHHQQTLYLPSSLKALEYPYFSFHKTFEFMLSGPILFANLTSVW